MFKNVQEIELSLGGGPEQGEIINKLALQAREILGTFCSMQHIRINSCRNNSGLRRLLMLDSCSKLSGLYCYPALQNDVPEVLNLLASYMRRTQCAMLTTITIPAPRDISSGFGDVSEVLMTGMAVKLDHIIGVSSGSFAQGYSLTCVGCSFIAFASAFQRCLYSPLPYLRHLYGPLFCLPTVLHLRKPVWLSFELWLMVPFPT